MRCWPVKWATPESAGGNGNTQSCRVLLKTGPCAFHKVLRSGIGNIDRPICASHPNKDGGLQTYCGNSSNTCIKATVEESYMCFPRCQLWSICMAICGTWQGCQQPYPKKCPTPWKATSREFSPNLEQFTQERKLLAGPKLLDQAVLPKALWETAFYDVQSEYLVLPWIPLRARYLTEAWNDMIETINSGSQKQTHAPSVLAIRKVLSCKPFQAQAALTCLPFHIPSFRKGANKNSELL